MYNKCSYVGFENNSYSRFQGFFDVAENDSKGSSKNSYKICFEVIQDYSKYNITALPILHQNMKMMVVVGVIIDDIHRF